MTTHTKRNQKAPPGAPQKPGGKTSTLVNPLAIAISVVIFLAGPATQLRAQSSQFQCSSSNTQFCGITNPISKPANAVVFPIDGLAAFAPGPSGSAKSVINTYAANPGGTAMSQTNTNLSIPFHPDAYYAAASGRIIAPGPQTSGNFGYPEDVVYAWRTGANVQVNFMDPTKDTKYGNVQLPANSWDGWTIAPRLDLSTYGATNDHIAIAVGDLDGFIDKNGETSDEVVVAFPAWDPTDNVWVPQIRVLNYGGASVNTNATVPPAITESDTHYNVCINCSAFVTSTSFATDGQNQHKILAAGSIISLAIGDFDGDGQNEVAMGTIISGDTLLISMYRYRNTGDPSTAELWWLSNTIQPASAAQANSSYVGSVSLAAGDFNNDGKDELAVAYEQWSKSSTTTPGKGSEKHNCILYESYSPDLPNYLFKDTCDYNGYGVEYTNFVTLYGSQLTAATIQSSQVTAGNPTNFTLTNALKLVSQNVFISGAGGTWVGMNGVWPATLYDNSFTIPLDSSSFGPVPASPITISQTAPFVSLQTLPFSPRIDQPESHYHQGPGPISGDGKLDPVFDWRDSNSRPTVQLLSGLFTMDPNTASTFHQRQLLVVWNSPSPADNTILTGGAGYSPLPQWPYDLVAGYVTYSTDGKNTPKLVSLASLAENPYQKNSYGYPHQRFSLTASNFFGATQSNDASSTTLPTWQFGIGAWLDNGGYHLRVGSIDAKTSSININQDATLPNGIQSNYEAWASFPIVAYDPDGSSYFLGSPVHMSVPTFKSPYFLLQEPPKHMAWIKASNGTYSILNLGRNSGTSSSVTTGKAQTDGTTAVSSSGWDIGNSVSVSAGASWGEGDPSVEGSEVTVQDTLKLGYERDASNSSTSANGASTVYQATAQTPNDDYLQLSATNYDVWRYRIYGAGQSTDANNPYKFYEIVIPGPPSTDNVGGKGADWYSPQHENGNVLSYPPYAGSKEVPSDLSPNPYEIDGQIPPGVTNGLMWSQTGYCTGGAAYGYNLTITGTNSSSSTVSYTNKFSEDNDLNVGTKVKANVFGTSIGYNASADWNFDAHESFGKANTSSNSTTVDTMFTFNLKTSSNGEWMIYPLLYNSLSGTVKLGYTVDIPSTSHSVSSCSDLGNFFTTYYTAEDPGLLLPDRWSENGVDNWGLTPGHERETLKSLFMEKVDKNNLATIDPNNPVYDKLASVPEAGTQVRLSVPVYNFSVGTATQPVTVNFSYMPVSSAQDPTDKYNNEQGCGTLPTNPPPSNYVCPDSFRQMLKNADGSSVQIIIPTIPAWGDPGNPNWITATTTWTIPASLANEKIRIYVNLVYGGTESNPPQAACTNTPCATLCATGTSVACTLPTQNTDPLAPGQNNEGFKDFQIGPAASITGISGSTLSRPTVYMTNDSLVALAYGNTWNYIFFGYQGQPIQLRVKAKANGYESGHQQVRVTDQTAQNPSPAGIAEKTLQGVGPQGSTAFFNWVPQQPGVHVLQAQLKQANDSNAPSNNSDYFMAVIFSQPGDINGDGFVDGEDLKLLEQENGKSVTESACGWMCDLNGDGRITNIDHDLAISMCSRPSCATAENGKSKALSLDEVRRKNEAELAQLRDLKSSDWSQILSQAEARGSIADLQHLKALQRLATTPVKGGVTTK